MWTRSSRAEVTRPWIVSCSGSHFPMRSVLLLALALRAAAELDLAKLLPRPRQATLALGAAAELDLAKLLPDPAKLLPTLHRRSLQQGDGANSCLHAYDGMCDEIGHPNDESSACPAGTDASDCGGSSEGSGHQCKSLLCNISNHCGEDMFNDMFDAAVGNMSSTAFMTEHTSTICGNADCKEIYSDGTDQLDAFCDIYDHCGEDMITDMIAMADGSVTSNSTALVAFMTDHMPTICRNADCKEIYDSTDRFDGICGILDHCGEDMMTDMLNITAESDGSVTSNETIRAFYIDNAIAVCGSADCKQAHHDAGLQGESGAEEIMEEVCAAGQVILIVATVVPVVGVCCIGVCIGLLLYAAAARPPANSPTPHPPPARPRARAPADRRPRRSRRAFCCCKKKKESSYAADGSGVEVTTGA